PQLRNRCLLNQGGFKTPLRVNIIESVLIARHDLVVLDHLGPARDLAVDEGAECLGGRHAKDPPCSDKLRCTAGSCKALLMAACTRAMISLGVLAGARMPHQDSASTGMPDSLNVGVSGSCGKRLAEVTASGRNALALICGDIRATDPIAT